MDKNKPAPEPEIRLEHNLSLKPDNPDLKPEYRPVSRPLSPSTSNGTQSSPGPTEPGPNLVQPDSDKDVRGLLRGFLIGLVGIGLIGLIFGITFNYRLVSVHGQYLGLLQDALHLEIFVPIATLIFGAVALALKKVTYLVYPVLAFFVAGMLRPASVSELLAGYIPANNPTNHPQYLTSLVAVTLAYVLVHAYVWPIRNVVKSFLARNSGNHRQVLIVSFIVFGVVTVVCVLVATYSEPLLIAQQRSRAVTRIPSSGGVLGSPEADYYLYQKNGSSYVAVGDVDTKPVSKWWSKSPQTVCGNQTTSKVHPGQSPTNRYGKTPGGVTYTTSVFTDNASQPALPTTAFKEYRYCFVLGYQHYVLVRNDRGDNAALLQKYPTGSLIDAIAKAPTYLPACSKRGHIYCKAEDASKLESLGKQVQRHRPSVFSTPATGVTAPSANKDAYKQVGTLSVAQWGVSFPLSAEIKDAYYSPKTDIEFVIKLHSLDSSSCFNTDGVAYLTRKPVSSVPTSPGSTVKGQVVGSYVYNLYGNADLTFCTARGAIDQQRADALADVFDWAEANLR